MSISPDVRKVQKSCVSENVNSNGKHLKQIKKIAFSSPFRKRGFGMWLMKNGVKMKIKDLVEEVGEKKTVAVFYTVTIV